MSKTASPASFNETGQMDFAGHMLWFGSGGRMHRYDTTANAVGTPSDNNNNRLWAESEGMAVNSTGTRLFGTQGNVVHVYDAYSLEHLGTAQYHTDDIGPDGSAGARWAVDPSTGSLFALASPPVAESKRIKRIDFGFVAGDPLTPLETLGACSPSFQGSGEVQNEEGDPVNTWPSSGNMWLDQTDMAIPGRNSLGWARSYNSLVAGIDVGLGYGWNSSWSMRASVNTGTGKVTIIGENGCQTYFTPSSGSYLAAPRVSATLERNGDGTWRFKRANGSTFLFEPEGGTTLGRLREVTDRNGYKTSLAYTSGRKVSTITDSTSGRALTIVWTGSRISSVRDKPVGDATGRAAVYSYDGAGDLTQVTDLGGKRWKFGYDGAHRLTDIYSPEQVESGTMKSTHNTYDAQGRVERQTSPLFAPADVAHSTRFDYTSIPGATKITDPAGDVRVDYYQEGLNTRVVFAPGTALEATWRYEYDPVTLGRTGIIDPTGVTVFRASYDGRGNRLTQGDAFGNTTRVSSYNIFGQPENSTDPAGVTTDFVYDGNGNLGEVCVPLVTAVPAGQTVNCLTPGSIPQRTSYVHGTPAFPGDVTSMIDPNIRTWTYEPDPATGMVIAETDPMNNKTTFRYDNVGRIEWTVAPEGNKPGGNQELYKTAFVTDAFGAVTQSTNPLGKISSRIFNADRNVRLSTDENLHPTVYRYDHAGQLRFVDRADTTSLENQYWDNGLLKAQIDGANQATDYIYDRLGRLKSVTDPNDRTTEYDYDLASRLKTRQEPGGNCGTNTGCTTYSYDIGGRPTTISYSDSATPDVTNMTYDALSRRRTQTLSDGRQYGWTWDNLGRLTKTTDPDTTAVGYGWDLNNNLTKIAYPGGSCTATPTVKCVTRGYDFANRWTSVTDWDSKTTTFGYDDNVNNDNVRRDTVTFPAGTGNVDTFTYDRAGGMTATSYMKGAISLGGATYTRTNSGQLASETPNGGGVISYGYDSIDRLTDFAGFATYEYDNADNLTKLLDGTRLVPDPANQLCRAAPGGTTGDCTTPPPAGSTRYESDNRGNRTDVISPTGRPSEMIYDQDNRLTSVNQGAEGEYNPVGPVTMVNTGTGAGICDPSPCARPAGGATIIAKVNGGFSTIPETGVRAVMLNVTASGSTAPGHLAVYPADLAAAPGTSNLNFATGEQVSNSVVAKVSSDGRVKIKNGSTAGVDIRVEVTGWFADVSAEGGTTFEPVTPARLMWTAQGGTICTPSPCARMNGNTSIAVDVTGAGPVPASGVSAVAVNVTAITTAAVGNLTVYKNGTAKPAQPNLYWKAGETHAAMVIVPVDTAGNIRIANNSTGATDVIVDVQGWFATTPDSSPNVLKTLTPARILNTTTSTGVCTPNCNRLTANTQKTIQISAQGNIPVGAAAASITVTVVNPAGAGWLEAAPNGSFVQGATSIVNYDNAETVANSAILKLPADGKIVLWASKALDVIIDVNGYFAAPQSIYTYTYDGDGLRRTKSWSVLTATYRYSHAEGLAQPIVENLAGFVDTAIIYGPGGLPVEQIQTVLGATTKVWFHHDQLGSTRLLTDETGNWRTKYAFDPYGNTASIETNPLYPTVTTNHQYAGQFTDNETGYQYLRNRYYDPATARFLTRDPITPLTRSAYGYVANAPTNGTDPTGLCSTDEVCPSVVQDFAGFFGLGWLADMAGELISGDVDEANEVAEGGVVSGTASNIVIGGTAGAATGGIVTGVATVIDGVCVLLDLEARRTLPGVYMPPPEPPKPPTIESVKRKVRKYDPAQHGYGPPSPFPYGDGVPAPP